MASQSFQAVKRLQDAGAPLPLVVANPAWQALMDKIDSNISERQSHLATALKKVQEGASGDSADLAQTSESSSKRARTEGSDLAARKQALLVKINKIEGREGAQGGDEDYEAYRRQCWMQYYEWMEKQKKGGEAAPVETSAAAAGGQSSEDEDEEIHNALLGLS